MEQDRNPRDKPTHLWVPYHLQKRQEYTLEKRQSLQNAAGKNRHSCPVFTYSCRKRMKLELFLTPYTKINTKWIKDLKASIHIKNQFVGVSDTFLRNSLS